MTQKDFSILYVDDEEFNLHAFRATFRTDYLIFTALSGREGIEIVRNNNIDLIITDQRMPEMTGIQFLETIVPEYPDIIRMILTGFSDVDAIISAINTGRVFRYITKPWDEKELRMTIENARQLSDLQKRNRLLMTELKNKMADQEKTLRLFMKYVPEPIVEKALKATEDTIFEGELLNAAVLFCDLRNFTAISELLTPKKVVALLNDYYSIMSECIRHHNGWVNQYVGDEIFAVFGAPIATENNEKNAVFCALDMMDRLTGLNQRYQKKFGFEINMGIGINSGEVIAGNLGSEEKIDYSITGDTVNTGKRIETLTEGIPNKILISDSVYIKTDNLFDTHPWGEVPIKGKKKKIIVYEIRGRK